MLKILTLILLIFEKSSASLDPLENSFSKLSNFVCDVSDKVSHEEVRTMAILESQNSFSSRFFDDLHKCMSKNIAMVQVDIKNAVDNGKLKDAKFVVVIGDDIDAVSFKYNYWIIYLKKMIS